VQPRIAIILLLTTAVAIAQNLPKDKWSAWQPFLGTWEGVGGGGPGQGSGSFSFTPELQGAVLVRHNYSQYSATREKLAYRHDDLMVIYPDGPQIRADYWDNEGHVIHYTAEFADFGRRLIMTSAASQSGPRYRLTYLKTGDNDLNLTFEIAPPHAPEKFKTYIEATARRKQ
jgi:hypothetical protein